MWRSAGGAFARRQQLTLIGSLKTAKIDPRWLLAPVSPNSRSWPLYLPFVISIRIGSVGWKPDRTFAPDFCARLSESANAGVAVRS
jgi:hypothetical protein